MNINEFIIHENQNKNKFKKLGNPKTIKTDFNFKLNDNNIDYLSFIVRNATWFNLISNYKG